MPTIKALLLSNMYMTLTAKKSQLLLAMYSMSIFMPTVQKVRASLIIFICILISIAKGFFNYARDLMRKQKRNA